MRPIPEDDKNINTPHGEWSRTLAGLHGVYSVSKEKNNQAPHRDGKNTLIKDQGLHIVPKKENKQFRTAQYGGPIKFILKEYDNI